MRFRETSSFTEFLLTEASHLITDHLHELKDEEYDLAPHGTTIIAVEFEAGVILLADRRATIGNVIASHTIDKIYIIDEYTALGFAGTVGIAAELIRLFAVEIEHYEKIEGKSLSFSGKANTLANMVKRNFPQAQQGLTALPLFVGIEPSFELEQSEKHQKPLQSTKSLGKIISFDVIGGKYVETTGYFAIGSGSVFARNSLKKLYQPQLSLEKALAIGVEALQDAADEDSATGGINLNKGIYPMAIVIDQSGARILPHEEIVTISNQVMQAEAAAPITPAKTLPRTTKKTVKPKNQSKN